MPRTPLTEADAERLLCRFALRLRGLRPLPVGTVNSNFAIDTDAGPLFLRVNEGKTPADAAFEAGLVWVLGGAGFPTPALWRTRSGAPFTLFRDRHTGLDKPVMVMSWVHGQERTEDQIGEAAARSVGATLARLHRAAAGFPHARPGAYTLAQIHARIARLHAEPRVPDGIVEHLQREAERLAAARDPGLPAGTGHQDLFPDNVLFHADRRRADEVAWVLDLEQAATVPYTYDLAVALLSFCAPTGPLLLPHARALLAGYHDVRPLLPTEQRGLYEELRFAALRFTVTRLTDVHLHQGTWGAHSKDYRDFLRRLDWLAEIGADRLRVVLFGGGSVP